MSILIFVVMLFATYVAPEQGGLPAVRVDTAHVTQLFQGAGA